MPEERKKMCPLLTIGPYMTTEPDAGWCQRERCALWTSLIDTDDEPIEDCVWVQIARKLNRIEGVLLVVASRLRKKE